MNAEQFFNQKTILDLSFFNAYFAICVGGLESGHASTAPDVVV